MKLSIKAIILLFIAIFAVVSAVSRTHKRSLRHKSKTDMCKLCHKFANFASCYYNEVDLTICKNALHTYKYVAGDNKFELVSKELKSDIISKIKSGALKKE